VPVCVECVECLIGKQKKPVLFKVTELSSIPYRTHPACAKRAAYSDLPPVIPVPDTGVAQAAYAETLSRSLFLRRPSRAFTVDRDSDSEPGWGPP